MDQLHGLEGLGFPADHPVRTVDAMRLCLAASPEQRAAVSLALYRALWIDGRDVSDLAVVQELAVEHGIDPGLIQAPDTKQRLREVTAAAAERGVFGVPSLQVVHPDGTEGVLHWGADRMHFIEEELSGQRVPQAVPCPPEDTEEGRQIDFFHDFSSPYSYLGATQVERTATRRNATLRWRPILLGALFRQIGTPNVPLFVMSAAKQAWNGEELNRWAAHHGVEFNFPSIFPVRTVLALRAALIAPSITMPLYRALWVEGRDISDPEVVAGVIAECGLNPTEVLEAAVTASNKLLLRQNNDEAIAAGVCGVPSYLVAQTHLVWGQDRLHVVDHMLAGWSPEGDAG
jgi:2-hydroxychromene-2-carboxylate isomerase